MGIEWGWIDSNISLFLFLPSSSVLKQSILMELKN